MGIFHDFSSPPVTLALSAILGCAVLSACDSTQPQASNVDPLWTQWVQGLIDNHPDAGEHQLAVANRALESGEVSYEDYSTALYNAFECIEARGVILDPPVEDQRENGLPILVWSFTVEGDPNIYDQVRAAVDWCRSQESLLVEILYFGQPAAQD
jgi:hypothetical protein